MIRLSLFAMFHPLLLHSKRFTCVDGCSKSNWFGSSFCTARIQSSNIFPILLRLTTLLCSCVHFEWFYSACSCCWLAFNFKHHSLVSDSKFNSIDRWISCVQDHHVHSFVQLLYCPVSIYVYIKRNEMNAEKRNWKIASCCHYLNLHNFPPLTGPNTSNGHRPTDTIDIRQYPFGGNNYSNEFQLQLN